MTFIFFFFSTLCPNFSITIALLFSDKWPSLPIPEYVNAVDFIKDVNHVMTKILCTSLRR